MPALAPESLQKAPVGAFVGGLLGPLRTRLDGVGHVPTWPHPEESPLLNQEGGVRTIFALANIASLMVEPTLRTSGSATTMIEVTTRMSQTKSIVLVLIRWTSSPIVSLKVCVLDLLLVLSACSSATLFLAFRLTDPASFFLAANWFC